MLNIPTFQRVALLIDADNIQLSHLDKIVKISAYYGKLKICRAYGDWQKPNLSASLKRVHGLNIETIQVDRIEKDTTDKQLMIEAGEILGAGKADLFIIVSGDADFRLLCERIKQKGRKVIGIGNKPQTSIPLQTTCDSFYYIERLSEILEPIGLLREACIQARDSEGWARIDQVGQRLRELNSEFKKHFGKKKLSEWLGEYPDIFRLHDNYVSLVIG